MILILHMDITSTLFVSVESFIKSDLRETKDRERSKSSSHVLKAIELVISFMYKIILRDNLLIFFVSSLNFALWKI